MPRRIQRKRTPGYKNPADAVYVGRPGPWGNPYKEGVDGTREGVVAMFKVRYEHDQEYRQRVHAELRGKDLMCWCPLDEPCHADVLLRWANECPV